MWAWTRFSYELAALLTGTVVLSLASVWIVYPIELFAQIADTWSYTWHCVRLDLERGERGRAVRDLAQAPATYVESVREAWAGLEGGWAGAQFVVPPIILSGLGAIVLCTAVGLVVGASRSAYLGVAGTVWIAAWLTYAMRRW